MQHKGKMGQKYGWIKTGAPKQIKHFFKCMSFHFWWKFCLIQRILVVILSLKLVDGLFFCEDWKYFFLKQRKRNNRFIHSCCPKLLNQWHQSVMIATYTVIIFQYCHEIFLKCKKANVSSFGYSCFKMPCMRENNEGCTVKLMVGGKKVSIQVCTIHMLPQKYSQICVVK